LALPDDISALVLAFKRAYHKIDGTGGSEFTIRFRVTAFQAVFTKKNMVFHAQVIGFLFRMIDTFSHNNTLQNKCWLLILHFWEFTSCNYGEP